MKTKLFSLTVVLSFFLNVFFTNSLFASDDDVCGTTANITGNSIPTSGTIKVFIVFAQFLDDPNTTTNGWARNTYPDWANIFVNAAPNGSSPWNNFSHYYNEMSSSCLFFILEH